MFVIVLSGVCYRCIVWFTAILQSCRLTNPAIIFRQKGSQKLTEYAQNDTLTNLRYVFGA